MFIEIDENVIRFENDLPTSWTSVGTTPLGLIRW